MDPYQQQKLFNFGGKLVNQGAAHIVTNVLAVGLTVGKFCKVNK
jgi:hypothetical protein